MSKMLALAIASAALIGAVVTNGQSSAQPVHLAESAAPQAIASTEGLSAPEGSRALNRSASATISDPVRLSAASVRREKPESSTGVQNRPSGKRTPTSTPGSAVAPTSPATQTPTAPEISALSKTSATLERGPVSAISPGSEPTSQSIRQVAPVATATVVPNPEPARLQPLAEADQSPSGPSSSQQVTGRIVHAPSEQLGVPDEIMLLTNQGKMLKTTAKPSQKSRLAHGASITATLTNGQVRITDADHVKPKSAFRGGNPLYQGDRTLHVVQVIPTVQNKPAKNINDLTQLGRAVQEYYARESNGQTTFTKLVVHPVVVRSQNTCEQLADLHDEVLTAIGLSVNWHELNIQDRTNVLAVMPPYGSCPGGRAYVGYGFGYVTNSLTKTMIHEVGHQLGLRHAAAARCNNGRTDIDLAKLQTSSNCQYFGYGDRYDVMGAVANLRNPGAMTAAHAAKLGYLNTRIRPMTPGKQRLAPYADRNASTRVLSYRDHKSRSTYHFFYRSKSVGQDRAFFEGLPKFHHDPVPGVVVTKTSWSNPWGQPVLILRRPASRGWDQTLPVGQKLHFADGALSVTVVSLSATGAQLNITVNGISTVSSTKTAQRARVDAPKQSEQSHSPAGSTAPATKSARRHRAASE